MSLLDDIKDQVKKSGTNKGKFIYFKSGTKIRIRFLVDMEDGIKVPFHDSFALGINVPCQEQYDRTCDHHENEELRHRDLFMWSVWDYEANETKLLLAAVNNFSPVPQLVAMYDTYGSMTDRDYVITKQGTQQTTSFSVVPMDKVKFRNEKAKPFSKTKAMQLLDKAYPGDASDDDEKPAKPAKNKPAKPSKSEDAAYEDMTPKELYDLCIEKEIEVDKKKPSQYYIDKLDEHAIKNAAADGWDDEEAPDYDSMTTKQLYDLCKEKEIAAEIKKDKKYYIDLLKAGSDEDGWEEDEEGGW